jgi:nitroreductase
MLNDLTTPLTYLLTRRTAKAKDMVAPGPSEEQMRTILTAAMRTPDHGKLAPWRFVIVGADQRGALNAMLQRAARSETSADAKTDIAAVTQFAMQAPTLVVVLSTPQPSSKVPLWEQQLSAGAACMNLAHAAHALGYGACWLTGWPAYSADVAAAFGAGPDDRIAGFIFLGTPGKEIEERPRPDYDAVVSQWASPA